MIIIISAAVIAVISVILAIRSVEHELLVPTEVANLKIPRKKVSGVILFLKRKIVHYTSKSS